MSKKINYILVAFFIYSSFKNTNCGEFNNIEDRELLKSSPIIISNDPMEKTDPPKYKANVMNIPDSSLLEKNLQNNSFDNFFYRYWMQELPQ